MNLVDYAKQELKLAGLFDKDSDYDGMLGDAVLELVKVLAKQGHSGCSASMALAIFNKVASYKPLSPLTLKDDEWTDIGHGFQNKRNSTVFKEYKDSRPYYIDAFYKRNETKSTYLGTLTVGNGRILKRCYIKDFNEMPKICIDVIDCEVNKETGVTEVGSGWWKEEMKDVSQLDELAKYYDLEFVECV